MAYRFDNVSSNGTPYFFQYVQGGKKNSPSLSIAVKSDCPVTFSVTAEQNMDGAAKSIGMSIECQTGDTDFDQNFYIISSSPLFAQAYFADPSVRDAIRRIFAAELEDCTCKGGMIEASWVGKKGEQIVAATSESVRDNIINDLCLIRDKCRNYVTEPIRIEHQQQKFLCTASWCMGGVIAALAIIVFIFCRSSYPVFSAWNLFLTSCVLSVPLFAICSVLLVLLVWGQSYAHRRLAVLVPVMLISCLFLGYDLAKYTNGSWDKSSPHVYLTKINDKRKSTGGRKSRTHYYLKLESWHVNGEPERIVVPSSIYNRASVGQRIEITTRDGYWGFEWMQEYKLR